MFSFVQVYRKYDPAAKSSLEILLLYPGVKAIFFHRIANTFYKLHFYFIARAVSELARFITGIDIHPGAKIGKNLIIDHGMGVVIGETAEIGDNVILYQGVTLGGTQFDPVKRHPTLQDGVVVGSGAKILGNIVIGEHTRIGANSVVIRSTPAHCTVVGVPARIIHRGIETGEELRHDQIQDQD